MAVAKGIIQADKSYLYTCGNCQGAVTADDLVEMGVFAPEPLEKESTDGH